MKYADGQTNHPTARNSDRKETQQFRVAFADTWRSCAPDHKPQGDPDSPETNLPPHSQIFILSRNKIPGDFQPVAIRGTPTKIATVSFTNDWVNDCDPREYPDGIQSTKLGRGPVLLYAKPVRVHPCVIPERERAAETRPLAKPNTTFKQRCVVRLITISLCNC